MGTVAPSLKSLLVILKGGAVWAPAWQTSARLDSISEETIKLRIRNSFCVRGGTLIKSGKRIYAAIAGIRNRDSPGLIVRWSGAASIASVVAFVFLWL